MLPGKKAPGSAGRLQEAAQCLRVVQQARASARGTFYKWLQESLSERPPQQRRKPQHVPTHLLAIDSLLRQRWTRALLTLFLAVAQAREDFQCQAEGLRRVAPCAAPQHRNGKLTGPTFRGARHAGSALSNRAGRVQQTAVRQPARKTPPGYVARCGLGGLPGAAKAIQPQR